MIGAKGLGFLVIHVPALRSNSFVKVSNFDKAISSAIRAIQQTFCVKKSNSKEKS